MARTKRQIEPVRRPTKPFRRAVLRGLAVLLPPLLTIVIFIWVGNTVADYCLVPLEKGARWILQSQADIRKPDELGTVEVGTDGSVKIGNRTYMRVADGNFVPDYVVQNVRKRIGHDTMPATANGVYEKYIDLNILRRLYVIPVFLFFFIVILYLMGRFLAAGMGKLFLLQFEGLVHRIPLIRTVYSPVKQVTDFLFSEREIEYTRVIAVEYPRKGIWSLAMVTGESMLDIRGAANEPVLSALIPTSPMPFTGFTVTVKKSETIDLNITIDQAFQFIVSCGVVVPPHQLAKALADQRSNTAQTPVDEPSQVANPSADS
ncbi:MAG: DUF502 domain-containing protein [Pirellulales bacterium]|nr:DUF502 domain-containing protein [Pirellulales bacterium]